MIYSNEKQPFPNLSFLIKLVINIKLKNKYRVPVFQKLENQSSSSSSRPFFR